MSVTTITKIKCDVCGKEPAQTIQSSVIFTTEQTEGRPVPPYQQIMKFELCDFCLGYMMDGNTVMAHGAQGHNCFYFREKPKRTRTKEPRE